MHRNGLCWASLALASSRIDLFQLALSFHLTTMYVFYSNILIPSQ